MSNVETVANVALVTLTICFFICFFIGVALWAGFFFVALITALDNLHDHKDN